MYLKNRYCAPYIINTPQGVYASQTRNEKNDTFWGIFR